ncbi:MAG: DPP IV N-terminal domain-containing protein [Sandaracinaceae bacterium]
MTTLSLLAGVTGCETPADGADPDEAAEAGPQYAPSATASPEFLNAFSETNRFRLGHPRAIEVVPDGSAVLFLRSGPRSFEGTLHVFDVASGEERPLLTAAQLLDGAEEELSAEEAARRERMRLTARGIASFRLSPDGSTLLVPLSGRLFLVDRARIGEADAVREIASDAGGAIDPRFSPDGTHIACVRAGDLHVIDVATGAEVRLTERASESIENGTAEFVAQEEMDRMRGYWWAPDGNSIVYQQTDVSAVERMHILDPMHPEREPESWPYPRPGATNATVRLGVIPIAGGETTWIDWDNDAFLYLVSVVWSAHGSLSVLVQDREQEEEVLYRVDPATGATNELLREQDEAWLNLDQSVPHYLPDGRFLWSTEREGGWRLELRTASGALDRALTEDGFGYQSVLAVKGDEVWVSASGEPGERHVFSVPMIGEDAPGGHTDGRGIHSASIARDADVWVHVAHPVEGDPSFTVMRGGESVGQLESRAEAPPFTPSVTYETVGRRDWRTAVVRPRDFDENLRYPVIVHVYGGPHVSYVTPTSRRFLLEQWQADHNFIVVTIDGRGTPGRGREWERAIDGDFISAPLEDQVEALQQLGDAHPEMDMERVGVWGWSFGGYFSAMAVLRRPDIFRAGVAGAPVSEWRDYDTHYTERYLGLPEADGEEGPYQRSSVLTYAVDAPEADHRPLLILHGTADDNVYFSHALKLQNRLLEAGRPGDLLALSGLTHMVPEPNIMRRMHQRIVSFFETNLRR